MYPLTHRTLLKRLIVAGLAALLPLGLFSLSWEDGWPGLALRVFTPALLAVTAYTLFEYYPRRLPAWLARWVLQVLAVALVMPVTLFAFYWWSTDASLPPFWAEQERLVSFIALSVFGLLIGPWVAMVALLRQRDAHVRMAERERGELERQALDARLRLLQAQVQPHFLFNTLANLQALVDSGSNQASPVLGQVIEYLRAAVPRLNEPVTRLGQELEMVRAYLGLMRMRMPDRLQFHVEVQAGCERLRFPPMTVMTLVENAIRHGIDPSLDGGRIDLRIREQDGRCLISVRDTGIGPPAGIAGLGSGLSSLRERLALAFSGDAELRCGEGATSGFWVDLDCPAQA